MVMYDEDDAPRQLKLDLERLSVEDLEDRIETLKAEIEACEAELKKKKDVKAAADSVFKL